MKKIKIGDKVIIDKDKAMQGYGLWYSNNIFIVKHIEKDIVELDKNLSDKHTDNKININYLKLLIADRKKKLLKLGLL